MTNYERAIQAQIAFLEAELSRIRDARAAHQLPEPDDSPIGWALRDPQFRAWLLRRQLESEAR